MPVEATRSRAPATIAQLLGRARTRAGHLVAAVERVRPVYVLFGISVAAWAATAALALTARHNGWLFYTGGDASYYWTGAAGLVHRWVAAPVISYGIPALLWPFAAALGTNMLAGLSIAILLQVVLLTPLLLAALYRLGAYFGGPVLGYVAACGWVAAPFLALGYFSRGFRPDIHNLVVPNTLGLTLLGDFTSLVCVTVAAALIVRSFERPGWNDVLLAGLVTGFAIGVKPSNGVFLPAPLLGLVVARRLRQVPAFVVAMLPAVVTLTVWKRIGVGYVPALALGDTHLAAGSSVAMPPVASLGQYLPFDWATFHDNLLELREVGWSVLILEWASVAGAIALIRRAPAAGVLVSTWFFSYVLLKGGAQGKADVMQTNFFRLIEPAYPALVLLAAGLVLLVPTWGRRRAGPVRAAARPGRPTPTVVLATVVLALYPLAIVGIASAAPRDRFVNDEQHNQSVPVTSSLDLHVNRTARGSRLTWQRPAVGATHVSFRVYRAPGPGCDHHEQGAQNCILRMAQVATVRRTTWTDGRRGNATYRVAVVADEHADRIGGDLIVITPPRP